MAYLENLDDAVVETGNGLSENKPNADRRCSMAVVMAEFQSASRELTAIRAAIGPTLKPQNVSPRAKPATKSTAPWVRRRVRNLRRSGKPTRFAVTVAFEVRTNRVVNPLGSVKRRFREFWDEISGCGGNLHGCVRTPICLRRNRESSALARIVASSRDKTVQTQNARRPISQRRALTGVAILFVEN